MSLKVFSARLPHHSCPGYVGADALNITRGSGSGLGLIFAPSQDLLNEGLRRKNAAKHDAVALANAWAWYEPKYVAQMRTSYRSNRNQWAGLLACDTVTLCCFCGTAATCHRTVLARLLVTLGAEYIGERPAPPAPPRVAPQQSPAAPQQDSAPPAEAPPLQAQPADAPPRREAQQLGLGMRNTDPRRFT